MKLFIWILLLSSFSFTEKGCRNKKKSAEPANCYKGRLEIRANCLNYTISIVSPLRDTSLVNPSWTDENTGKIYKNAFALGSKCNFPDSIKQGNEFYFVIDSSARQDCAVCLMYYPVPTKQLPIRVIKEPCSP